MFESLLYSVYYPVALYGFRFSKYSFFFLHFFGKKIFWHENSIGNQNMNNLLAHMKVILFCSKIIKQTLISNLEKKENKRKHENYFVT
jgi:hypothetical protein